MIDLKRLDLYRESRCLEAKKALGGLPESLWETYSAFANTLGGVILLGVEEYKDRSLHPVDLPDPEALIQKFWSLVRDPKVVSVNLLTEEHITWLELDGKDIIAIEIPQAQACDRPVYIGQNPYTGSYYSSGDGDYRYSSEEVRRMLQNAGK